MDKIKNIFSPGKAQDDETLYGTGQSNTTNANTGALAGEGSHFGNTRDNTTSTTSQVPGAFPSTGHSGVGTAHDSSLSSGTGQATTGPHSSNIANQADPRVDSDNSRATGHLGLTSSSGTGVGTAHTSGPTSGSTTTTSGPHSSNVANVADPRVDSDNSRNVGNSGLVGSTQSSGLHSSHNTGGLSSVGIGQGSHLSRENENSGHHLGRDAAAVGTTGAIGEGIHQHGQHQGNVGSAAGHSGIGSTTQGLPGSNTGHSNVGLTSQTLPHHGGPGGVTSTNQSPHLGRDAAAIGTAGAVGEGIHHHNQGNTSSHTGQNPTHNSGVTGAHSGHTQGQDSATVGSAGVLGQSAHQHNSHIGTGTQNISHQAGSGVSGTNQSSGHHFGRDAAALGTAGAVGEGVHHHNQTTGGTGYSGIGSSGSHHLGPTGSALNTSGPHHTSTANRLDPSVNRSGGALEDAHIHTPGGGGGEEADRHHRNTHGAGAGAGVGVGSTGAGHTTTTSTTTSTGVGHSAHGHDNTSTVHHLGRDAAVAGGVGGAAYEAEKHHNSSTTLDGPAPNTAGPHGKDWMNKLDPRVDAKHETTTGSHHTSNSTPQSSSTKDHHLGRDAAVAGGVGGAGYEAGKHHHTDNTTAGPHSSLNRADPTIDSDRSKDHHYGKDAAVAGGVGGAAYGADKHHNEKKLEKAEHKHEKELEKEAKKEHKHDVKEEKHEQKERKGGLFSFLHRDKSKKYTPEEEAEFDRQEREHNSTHGTSHTGRDAALGGAAVGTGAYGAEKHHHSHETGTNTTKPLPTAPGNHGVGTGSGTQNALTGETGQHGHHGGAVPLAEKPRGTDIGDKLHGVDRNRGVAGTSGLPGSEGFGSGNTHTGTSTHNTGRDAAGLGAAGLIGEHEYRKHENTTGQHSGLTGTGHQSSVTGAQHSGLTQGSHTGRDTAALGAAGALGGHEYRQHENTTGQHTNLTGSGQQSGIVGTGHESGLTGHHSNVAGTSGHQSNVPGSGAHSTSTGHSHTGRDAAGLGAAGALGEHEYRKHENTSDNHSGLTSGQHSNVTETGQHSGSGLTGSGQHSILTGTGQHSGTGHHSNFTKSGLSEASTDQSGNAIGGSSNISSGIDGRNRLHKDPPASHPAAQAYPGDKGGVPASGSERERMIGQGEQRLDSDTGVHNAGPNSSTNY